MDVDGVIQTVISAINAETGENPLSSGMPSQA